MYAFLVAIIKSARCHYLIRGELSVDMPFMICELQSTRLRRYRKLSTFYLLSMLCVECLVFAENSVYASKTILR
ncbi:hypothetical protein DAEQUDRAFT_194621 [Daedalea quercina L-15889]|uniref:Uncharacterized protein n=1 Tax=Daedalea quercina L-15889 TaxID=1314783 RepID=A0A165U6N0_9APHY|nr:hypothetical protein DAEQUDRAFT_194621 [Daedalea quercina L-15889]